MRFCINYPLKCTKKEFVGQFAFLLLSLQLSCLRHIKKLIGLVNVSYQCIWGRGGQNKKKVHVVTCIGEQDREVFMCVEPNKSRRQTSSGVPEMSSERGTDVRCWGKKFVTMWNGLSDFSLRISWPQILTVDWYMLFIFLVNYAWKWLNLSLITFARRHWSTYVSLCQRRGEYICICSFAPKKW